MRRDRSWPKRCRRRDLMWPSLHHQQHQHHHQQQHHKHRHHHPHHLQQLIIIAELSSEFCGQKQFCIDILGRCFNMRLVWSWKACFFQVWRGSVQDACPSLLIDNYKPREQEKCLQSPIMEAAVLDTMKQNRMKTDSCIPSYTHPLTTSILWSRLWWRWCIIVYSYCSLYETLLPRQSTTISDISAIPTKEAPPWCWYFKITPLIENEKRNLEATLASLPLAVRWYIGSDGLHVIVCELMQCNVRVLYNNDGEIWFCSSS